VTEQTDWTSIDGVCSVFRELLQNSDDAQSKAVEIHFQTKKFVDRANAGIGSDDVGGEGNVEQVLPDLSTALVCGCPYAAYGLCSSFLFQRCINGHSRIMGYCSVMKIGVD
jgi:hypothetical protein